MDYKGYTLEIGYNDMINCNDLDLSANTVPEIKRAIDAHISKANAAQKEPALLMGWGKDEPLEVIAGAFEKGYGGSLYRWVTQVGSKKRSKEPCEKLYKDSPGIRAMFLEYKKLKEVADAATKRANDYLDSIPNMGTDTH